MATSPGSYSGPCSLFFVQLHGFMTGTGRFASPARACADASCAGPRNRTLSRAPEAHRSILLRRHLRLMRSRRSGGRSLDGVAPTYRDRSFRSSSASASRAGNFGRRLSAGPCSRKRTARRCCPTSYKRAGHPSPVISEPITSGSIWRSTVKFWPERWCRRTSSLSGARSRPCRWPPISTRRPSARRSS